jgi:hypothetical protein
MTESTWQFEDPPNVAVLTSRKVVHDRRPILFVSHDADDGAWQFHTGDETPSQDALVVALRSIVKLDPSIEELADLPFGWIASRSSGTAAWTRSPRVLSNPSELT